MGCRSPLLSLVVVVYNMRREAPRTLFTLTSSYQRLSPDLYEVIVVDNGSSEPLGEAAVHAIDPSLAPACSPPGCCATACRP